MSNISGVGKLPVSLTHKLVGKVGKSALEKSRYAIGGGSPKSRKKTRCGNISRTWANKSLNKSRVLARSLHTNNRTLAKKLNAVLVELSNCEEAAAVLRDDNEQLRQGTRFKDEAIEDLNRMIGQIAQLLVSAGKRAQDALAWPHPETHADTFTLENSERVMTSEEPRLSLPEASSSEDPQNPFQKRDRIPRTPPVVADGESLSNTNPTADNLTDLPPRPDFAGHADLNPSPTAAPRTDHLQPTTSLLASAAAVTTSVVCDEPHLPPSISPIAKPATPPAKPKAAAVTKRKDRGTFTKPLDPPAPTKPREKGDPALAVYDFSMSETMNQTNLQVPSLADLRAQSEQVDAVGSQEAHIRSESAAESVSGKTKKSASSEKAGASEAALKKRKPSKASVKEKVAKTTKASKAKPKVTEASESESAESVSEKTAKKPTPDLIPEKEETGEMVEKIVSVNRSDSAECASGHSATHPSTTDAESSEKKTDCEANEDVKDVKIEEAQEAVKGSKPVKKRVGWKRTEEDDAVEAPKSKKMRKEKAKEKEKSEVPPCAVDMDDAEDLQDFAPDRLSAAEPRKAVDKKASKKLEKIVAEKEKKEEEGNVEKNESSKMKKGKDEEEAGGKEKEEKKKSKAKTKRHKKSVEKEEKKESEEVKEETQGKNVEKIEAQDNTENGDVKIEKAGVKEKSKKTGEKKLTKKTARAEEEEEEKENDEPVNVIGKEVRISECHATTAPSKEKEKRKKFKRLVSFDDSDDSLVVPESVRKKMKEDVLLETPRQEASKEEKGTLFSAEITGSCRPRRAKAVNLREPSARGKLRRGDPEWCRTNN